MKLFVECSIIVPDLTHVEIFFRNWARCLNWHSFSARAQNLLDPIHAIAKTVVSPVIRLVKTFEFY